jgi:hypothetical protein
LTRRGRSGRPQRRLSQAARRKDILVFAEGLKTEEQYVVHWHRKYRDRVNVVLDDFRGGPLQLVQHAVEAKRTANRDARRGRGRAFDEIWCICDVDAHPNLAQARSLAADYGISLAVSNPCIELWFILHFEDQTAFIERRVAQARAKEHLKCDKALSNSALHALDQRHEEAAERARQLDVKHEGDGSPAGANPSSSVWRLTESIRSA